LVQCVSSLPRLKDPERIRLWLLALATRHCAERRSVRRGFRRVDRAVHELGIGEGALQLLSWTDRAKLLLFYRHASGRGDVAEVLGGPADEVGWNVRRAVWRWCRERAVLALLRDIEPSCGWFERKRIKVSDQRPQTRRRTRKHLLGCNICNQRQQSIVTQQQCTLSAAVPPWPMHAPTDEHVLQAIESQIRSHLDRGGKAPGRTAWQGNGFPVPGRRRTTIAVGALALSALIGGGFGSATLLDQSRPSVSVLSQTPITRSTLVPPLGAPVSLGGEGETVSFDDSVSIPGELPAEVPDSTAVFGEADQLSFDDPSPAIP
jgi:hypothetical protein